MSRPVKLALRNVGKSFGAVAVVRSLTLELTEGESLVLLGPSGCGKTTTLRMVAGFIRPDEGEVWIDGRTVVSTEVNVPPEKRNLGMVFQSYAVWPHKTVAENIAFGPRLRGADRHEVEKRVLEALCLVKMQGLEGRYPAELSGGQQQRVALARALAVNPSLLLLDEPLSNLDAGLREEMRFELQELQKRLEVTTLYVTHDQQEAMVLADRIAVMNIGSLEQVGAPAEIYTSPASRFVASFIGLTNLIQAKVVRADPQSRRVFLESRMGPLEGMVPESEEIARPGQEVHVSIRPEDLRVIRESPQGGNGVFPCRVTKATFLGSHTDLRLEVEGLELRCQLSGGDALREGMSYVCLPAEKCRVLTR